MRLFYEKNGLFFTAMCPTQVGRQRDLTERQVKLRESRARIFKTGWDERLVQLGLVVLIEYNEHLTIWMVEAAAIAMVLNCSPRTVEKNFEVMRYLRYLPVALRSIPIMNGFRPTRTRRDPTVPLSLGAAKFSPPPPPPPSPISPEPTDSPVLHDPQPEEPTCFSPTTYPQYMDELPPVIEIEEVFF